MYREGPARSQTTWISEAKKTILIPFDLSSISMKKVSELAYAKRIKDMIERVLNDLQSFYGSAPPAKGIVFGRHAIYLVEPRSSPVPIKPAEAARLIREEPLLFIAAPLPSALDVDQVVELAKTTSSAFPDELENLASSLGAVEAGMILELKGLSDVAQALIGKTASKSISSAILRAAEQAWKRYVRQESTEKDPCVVLIKELKPVMGFVDCRAVAGLAATMLALEALDNLSVISEEDPRYVTLRQVAAYLPLSEALHAPGMDPWEVLAWAYEHDRRLEEAAREEGRREGAGREAEALQPAREGPPGRFIHACLDAPQYKEQCATRLTPCRPLRLILARPGPLPASHGTCRGRLHHSPPRAAKHR